jgi:hypothetical protein
MANPSYTYTLTNGTTADASQVMQNFNDILNGVTDGTKDLSISALTCAGTATLNGNVNLGNASGDDLTVTASLASTIPIKTTATYDIGSSTKGLAGAYFGANSQTVRIVGSGSMSATWTLTLPTTAGTADYVLSTNGSGVTSWIQIANANVAAAAAIAGTKISPNFGSQNILTTGIANGIGNGGAGTPEAFLHLEGNASVTAQPSLLIRDRDTAVDSNNYLLWLDFDSDADCTGGRFVTFHDSDGQIGSITAANGTTVAYNTSSDARLKENIVPMTGAVERVKLLNPATYTWKRSGKSGEGFIAQELMAVIPHAVSGDPEGDANEIPLGIDYSKLTPVLAAALKEVITRLEALEAAA